MTNNDKDFTEKFGPGFLFYLDEQELFESHIEYLKDSVDSDELLWIAKFGRIGLLGCSED